MTIEEAMEKTGTYFDRYIIRVLRFNGYLDEKDQVTDDGIAYIEKMMLFRKLDSDLVKIERIIDVLDELTEGTKTEESVESIKINGDTDTIELGKKGEENYIEYIGKSEKLEDRGIIDYRLVLGMLKQLYLSADKSVTTYENATISEEYPKGDDSYITSPLDLGENPEERMKQIASEFFEDLFTIEKDGKRVPVNDYAKTLLEATKTILSGEDSKYGKLMIYSADDERAKKWPKGNGSNGEIEVEDENGEKRKQFSICLPIHKNQNGEKIYPLQKLYTLIHEISHSLNKSLLIDNSTIEKNAPRTERMLGENESMIFESLFSNFLYKKIEQNPEFIQLATTDDSKKFVTQDDIFKCEHGPSRVRDGLLVSLFKLGCWFYQEGKDEYIDYEDVNVQKDVMESIFPGRYDSMQQEQIEAELAELNVEIKGLKLGSPVHAYSNYQPNRYFLGNLLAPYIVNTILADKKIGIDMLESFWATGVSPDIDKNGGIEAVLKAIGIVITRDKNGNIIDSPDGLTDIHMLTSEYNEWIANASRQNGDMFNGKTRVVPSRILTQESMEEQKEPLFLDSIEAQEKRQERAIEESKENQDIGE